MSIPKKIYQSWKTKNLDSKMQQLVQRTKDMNPGYEYELWDDNDCRQFLLDNFGKNYANAFDVLIPGAFKCDFWRYAILYIKGGIYMDMDMSPELPFDKILRPDDKFVSIVDMEHALRKGAALYQAFIACVPNHPVMLYSLQLSFYNISTRVYEIFTSLSVTGPVVAGIALNLYWENPKTYDDIKPGEYENGVRLFQMDPDRTWDKNGQTIFQNKYDGYVRGTGDYTQTSSYYKDDPKRGNRELIKRIIYVLIFLIFLGLMLSFFFSYKFKKCESTCDLRVKQCQTSCNLKSSK